MSTVVEKCLGDKWHWKVSRPYQRITGTLRKKVSWLGYGISVTPTCRWDILSSSWNLANNYRNIKEYQPPFVSAFLYKNSLNKTRDRNYFPYFNLVTKMSSTNFLFGFSVVIFNCRFCLTCNDPYSSLGFIFLTGLLRYLTTNTP